MPEAFEKLAETETLGQDKEMLKKSLEKTKSTKSMIIDKFIPSDYLDIETDMGYFSELNSRFKSSSDEIRKNYVEKMQQMIGNRPNLSFKKDKFILKDLWKLVNTYKVLEKEEDRQKYLQMLRLRSLASQYNSILPLVKDGHFFPFLIFVVRQNDEQRIIELNFVEDILFDRYKDHCQRSYHFSMIKRVNKTVEDDGFIIEFNNETFCYSALVPGQRDYIVAMITVAMEESQISLRLN